MADAQCLCGALKLKSQQPSKLVVACHCFACQRRTGSPFSVGAFYAIDTVEISGAATEFVRVGDSGRRVRIYFCPTCGSTVYWKPDALPSMIGVAVGALADAKTSTAWKVSKSSRRLASISAIAGPVPAARSNRRVKR